MLQKFSGLVNSRTLGVASAFVAKIAGAGLGFLFSILLAQLLGASSTGVYFLLLTIVSIGATIARLGLDNAVLRFAAVAHNQGDRLVLAALYRQGMGLVVIAGTPISLFAWLAVPYLQLGGDRSSEIEDALPLFLLALVPTALLMLQGEFFKATGAPGAAVFIQAVLQPLFLVVGATVFFWQDSMVVYDIVFLYTFTAIASVLLAIIIWSNHKPGLWRDRGYFDIRLLLRTSLPLLWVASVSLVIGWSDVLVLGVWTDSATVGVYGIATRIAALTAFVPIAVNSVVAPQFAIMHSRQDHRGLERLAQRSARWMLLATLPIIIILLLVPEWILLLFGSDFTEGAPLLRILSVGQLMYVAMGSVGFLLMMTGNELLMRNNIFISAALNILGNIILVPIYGAIGAAVSTAFSLMLMNVLAFLQVNRKLKINTMKLFLSKD